MDWTLNGATDAVYFGLAGGDALTPSGSVQRLSIEAGNMALSALLPTRRSLSRRRSHTPTVRANAGFGLAVDDCSWRRIASTTEQAFYALKESSDVDAVASDLVDVTGVDQGGTGALTPDNFEVDGESVTTIDQLNAAISVGDGWKLDVLRQCLSVGKVIEPAFSRRSGAIYRIQSGRAVVRAFWSQPLSSMAWIAEQCSEKWCWSHSAW